jgi:hypothetical protein
LTLGAYAVLRLGPWASYLSFKILSYGAPFLVLLALGPFALERTRVSLALATVALVVPSAAVATVVAVRGSTTPGDLASLPRLRGNGIVGVELSDPWQQAWALYYLRDRRLSVEQPSFLLTGQGEPHPKSFYRHRPLAYVLGDSVRGRVVWRRGDFVVTACPC